MPKYKPVRGAAKPANTQNSRRPRDTTIPGTHTKENNLVQARRFLGHQRDPATSSPFTIEAIRELERVFHKRPEVRIANPASGLSEAGKHLLSTFEDELENARARGITADWWTEGNHRKGVSVADQKAYAAARRALKEGGASITSMIGVEELGMDDFELVHTTEDDLFDRTEAGLEGVGSASAAEKTEEGDDEDLSRFDGDADVAGYEDVLKGMASIAMSSEDNKVDMEDV